jgi:hypothetical protein
MHSVQPANPETCLQKAQNLPRKRPEAVRMLSAFTSRFIAQDKNKVSKTLEEGGHGLAQNGSTLPCRADSAFPSFPDLSPYFSNWKA